MTTEDSSVAPSSSDCSEKLEAIKSASELLAQGKRNLVCGEIPQAVNLYQEAVQLLVKACGELSRDCADAYFCYGCALLDLGRMETNVLGVALEGVEVEEENEEAASEQFEKPPSDECEERQKLREEVYEAMAEGEREEKLQKTCLETSEREDREMETNIEANKETNIEVNVEASRETNKETNVEANKETNMEASRETNKETNIEANKETDIKASRETNIEANKETDTETNKETNIEANKETDIKASRETNIEANKETNEANKETDMEANKETDMEANKETDMEANKETDLEANKETNVEANKETNIEANKETNIEAKKETNVEAKKETNVEGKKETNVEANKETNVEANKEVDTEAGSCGSVKELCSVSACESQEKNDTQEDENNACAVEHSDDMVKDDSKNQETNISKEDSVDCQADISEKYSGCASENQEGGVIVEDTENKEEKHAKLAEISQSTSDQEHVITRENQEQESISSSDKSGQEGESEMDKQLDDGGPSDNQQEHASMEVSSEKKEGKDCESAADTMDVTENSDSNENKDTGTNIAPRSDAPEQERGDLSENKVKESVIKSHGEDDLTQDETNKQKDSTVTGDVLTSSHDGGESSPQTQAAGAGAVQPDCVAEPDVPAGQAQNSDDVEMTENDDAADEGREDVDENEVVDEDDEINADDKDTEEEGEDKEEDVPNFQLAWEYLDLAKVIYLRSETSEDQLKAAECYIKLGELSMEIDQHATAAEDLQSALKIQQKLLSVEDRVIAETHYQLGLAYALGREYELSVQYYTQALGVIQSKIDLLKKLVREKGDDGENKENFEVNEQKKYIDEIAELQALIPEIKIKIEDTREESKDFEQMKQKCIEVLGFSKEAGSDKKSERADQEDIHENVEQEASNIAHLVRKKRKPEREEQELEVLEAKKIRCEDDCSSNLDKTINGSSQTEINAAGEGCPAEQAKDNPVPAEQTAA